MRRLWIGLALASSAGMVISACSGGGSSAPSDGGSSSGGDSTVSGKLANVSVSAFAGAPKTVTHVMAVNASNNPDRYVSTVGADGSFSLGLTAGKPYVIVFIAQDGVLKGSDMIAGIVKSTNGLDTLPVANKGTVGLGTVTVASGEATSSEGAGLLTSLGVTASEASHIGKIDDLSLRLANPDIDGNGVIDTLENKKFGLEWHILADTKIGSDHLVMDDIKDQFVDPATLTLEWTVGSANVKYPTSFDGTAYLDGSGALINGGDFEATGTSIVEDGFSGYPNNNNQQWGPRYDMDPKELAASDAVSTFAFTLGSPAKKLTFSNVKTKTIAELNQDGLIMPLLKLNTVADKLTGISYKWVKRSGGAWVDATATELALLVLDPGGYLKFYSTSRAVNPEYGISFRIPKTAPTGTVNIGDVDAKGESLVRSEGPININAYGLENLCSSALSYDDSVGLRIFAGSPRGNSITTGCN